MPDSASEAVQTPDTDQMSRINKIFGVGNLKTGTTSLGSALTMLGFKHTHERRNQLLQKIKKGNLDPVFRWVDRHDSFEDWPWPLLYKQLDERYPDSRFILTVRKDPKVWLKSMVSHAEKFGPTIGREMFFGFDSPLGHEDEYLERYLSHNQEVRDYFKDRPEQLLEVCWEEGDSWEKLCPFVGKEIPSDPFPHLNSAGNRTHKASWLRELLRPIKK